ncbi:efflux RND transporter periplasmic adaptor subunit [Desulfosarcina sp. OttesenSCG-928-B08]|nr:efflux RND transporter periplasmic adaptor subunit [Desulfosarcina sp. OttesenSCG-928-B08]
MCFSVTPCCSFAAEAVDGIIEPSVTVKFGTNSTGIIKKVYVDRGDFIKKNQIIVALESGVEAAMVQQIQELLALARRKQNRSQELAQKDLISKQEIDEIETDVRQLEAQLHEAKARLKLKDIRSTIDGIVTERFLYAGEYAGETTPVLQAAAIDHLHVEIIAPIRLYNQIQEGMPVRILPEDPVGGSYAGTVTLVDKVMDAASGTFGARILLPNPDHRIPAGIKCTVQLMGEE